MSKTYAEERKKQQLELREEERQAREDAAIKQFFQRHADVIADCTASWRAVIDYFNGDPVTSEALESSWTNHPAFRQMLATHSPQEDRDKLEEGIKALLSGGHSPQSVNEQCKKFKYKNTEELRIWCKELQDRKDAREKSPDELRAVIRAAAPVAPELPAHINRFQILTMLSASELRHLIKRYGAKAVTDRANRRD
jgi:hypothetical protein